MVDRRAGLVCYASFAYFKPGQQQLIYIFPVLKRPDKSKKPAGELYIRYKSTAGIFIAILQLKTVKLSPDTKLLIK